MHYYRINARVVHDANSSEHGTKPDAGIVMQNRLAIHFDNDCDGAVFIAFYCGNEIILGAISRDTSWLDRNLSEAFSVIGLESHDISIEETTFRMFKNLMRDTMYDNYINSDEILQKFDVDDLGAFSSLIYREHMLPESVSGDSLFSMAADMLCADTLVPELERIYQPAKESIAGHPVHYVIRSDNKDICDNIYKTLLSALYVNNRINTRRFAAIGINENFNSEKRLDSVYGVCSNIEKQFHAFYRVCAGGAIVIKFGEALEENTDPEGEMSRILFGKDEEENYKRSKIHLLETLCHAASKHRNETLTIFCLPGIAAKANVILRERLGLMTLIEISETSLSYGKAKLFLRKLAERRNAEVNKSLYESINNGKESYTATELTEAFDVWYNYRLKSVAYPQYAPFRTSRQVSAGSIHFGDAYAQLDALIGLDEAKRTIKLAADYFKAQKLLRDREICNHRPTMHMIFSGSPGTAKTTAARLFARIMHENELLTKGELFEVSRADLVGKYVGWTAQMVKNKFREAKGSVIFIDEAYSLLDDREHLYGDEAISTIVAEMENNRDDTVVIFAGYTEKMEAFLKSNPGLRSRIAFHIHFADYSIDELYRILKHIAGTQSMSLYDDVESKVRHILSRALTEPDFGNGRFVRNLFEKARMKQAQRLLATDDIDNVTAAQAAILVADDFELPNMRSVASMKIGFNL